MPEPSKFATNQFITATVGTFILTSEIIADAKPKLTLAASQDARFNDILSELISTSAAWGAGEIVLTNYDAAYGSWTLGLETKLDSLTRNPTPDTNSVLEDWDIAIRGQVPHSGPVFKYLLKDGRETLTKGTIEQQLDAGDAFAIRLSEQTAKAVLVTLSTTVTAFYVAARALRNKQLEFKNKLTDARRDQEALRILNCKVLNTMVGIGMGVYRDDLLRVDDLFSVSLLRGSVLQIPSAPIDTTFVDATKTASTSVMPAEATRLEIYRQAPGGAPELLGIGEPGELSITIDSVFLFTAGVTYQIWLQGRNSKGSSEPGPKVDYTPE